MQTSAELDGTLGYEGAPGRRSPASAGTVTRLPAEGRVIERGEVLYELDGKVHPRLLYGDRPMWRPMRTEACRDGDRRPPARANLKALGYAPKGMNVDRRLGPLHHPRGQALAEGDRRDPRRDRSTASDLVFLPGAVRVAEVAAEVGRVGGAGDARCTTATDADAGRDPGPVGEPAGPRRSPGQAVTRWSCPTTRWSPGRCARSGGWRRSPRTASTTVPVTIDIETRRRAAGAGRRARRPSTSSPNGTRTCWRCRSTRWSRCSRAATRSRSSRTTGRAGTCGSRRTCSRTAWSR